MRNPDLLASASGHQSAVHLIVFGGIAVAAYCLFVLLRPIGTCWFCRGRRVITPGDKVWACPVCKATGKARRPFAGPVHRFFWIVAGDLIRDRIGGMVRGYLERHHQPDDEPGAGKD